MKIHPLIASAFVALTLGLQAWTLNEVVGLKVQIATHLASNHHALSLAK